MKILYHHRTQYKGVEGVHIRGVVKALKELGHEVHVVAMVEDAETGQVNSKNNSSGLLDKYLHLFANYAPDFIFRFSESLYNIVGFFKIREVLKKNKIDLIYERYAYFNFSGVLASRIYKTPLILEVNIFTGLNDTRTLSFKAIAVAIEKRVFRISDAIFVISDYLKDFMVRTAGLDPGKIHVHPNAVEAEMFEKRDTYAPGLDKIDSDGVVIVFLGRLLAWYKLQELVTVFSAIQKSVPRVQLVFIGDGPERSGLEEQLKQLGIADQGLFCGAVSHEQALTLLARCDIGVIASTNPWTSPMKLCEYMGAGLPVVAPNIGSITTVMTSGLHGRVFPFDDFSAFKEVLETLVKDRELRKSMGEKAKSHILENHTWEKVALHIAAVANDLSTTKEVDLLE